MAVITSPWKWDIVFSRNVDYNIFHLVQENYFPSNYGTTQKLSIIWMNYIFWQEKSCMTLTYSRTTLFTRRLIRAEERGLNNWAAWDDYTSVKCQCMSVKITARPMEQILCCGLYCVFILVFLISVFNLVFNVERNHFISQLKFRRKCQQRSRPRPVTQFLYRDF